jgi:hypothetical protein
LLKIVTRPPSSAAVSDLENGISEDSENEIGGSESSDLQIHGMNEEDAAEEWERNLDESVQHSPAEIRDWKVLRTQIKQDYRWL